MMLKEQLHKEMGDLMSFDTIFDTTLNTAATLFPTGVFYQVMTIVSGKNT